MNEGALGSFTLGGYVNKKTKLFLLLLVSVVATVAFGIGAKHSQSLGLGLAVLSGYTLRVTMEVFLEFLNAVRE